MARRTTSRRNTSVLPTPGAGRSRRPPTPSSRGAFHALVQAALATALFGVLQLLASLHNVRFDTTPTKQFVLSEAARQVAAGITEEVRITVFYNSQEPGRRRDMGDLLEQFHEASSRIRYRFLDLDRSPALAKKYGVSSYNTGAIEAAGRVFILKSIDEEEITHLLLKLSRGRPRTVCFLTGHGEHSPDSADERSGYSEAARALERENFAIRTLDTVPLSGVPVECTIVIAAGPAYDLLPGEARLLEAFVRAGGSFMLLLDPEAPESFVGLVRSLGGDVRDDRIVDDRTRLFGADSFTVHIPIFDREAFGGRIQAAAIFPLARSVRPADEAEARGLRVSVLAISGPGSWARVGKADIPAGEARFRKDIDERGPLPVALLVTVPGEAVAEAAHPKRGRVAVFGDADFAGNFYLNLLGNKDLFLSTIALLAEDPELVAVRRKGALHGTLSPITLTAPQGRLIFWVTVVAQPAAFVITGIAVALVRRRRRGGR